MWERAPFFSRSLDLSVSRLKWFFSLEISGPHIFMFYHFCFVVSDECTRSTHHTSSGSSSMIMITMRLLIDQVHHLSNYCQDNYLESSVLFLPPIFWKTKATTNAALMKKVGDNGPITIPTTANGWVSVGTSRSELKCPMPIRAIPLNYPPPLCCQMAQNYGGGGNS